MAKSYPIVLNLPIARAVFADKWVGNRLPVLSRKGMHRARGKPQRKRFRAANVFGRLQRRSPVLHVRIRATCSTMRKYVHLLTGKSGDTEIAVLLPDYSLSSRRESSPTIQAAYLARSLRIRCARRNPDHRRCFDKRALQNSAGFTG